MTTITKQAPPAQTHHASLAIADDPSKALHLAPTFHPDVDLLTSEGLIAFGVKGSGKSNLLALLTEQLGRFLLPQIILDTEHEYQSLVNLLPHGIIASANRCPSGYDILHKGLQVILDLQSWETDEAAALSLCQLIHELFTVTAALAPQERVPCIIHLDEAGYWLPQEAVSYLSKETRKALADAFHKLASRGRKQGPTPFLYTQSISEVTKSAIRQAGVKVLMRQTLDVDLARYCQYIQGATAKTRRAIAAYSSGKAIVLLPDGSQHRVQFTTRTSEHPSQTPQARAALVKFAALDIDVSTLPMRDLSAEMPVQPDPVQKKSQVTEKGTNKHAPARKTKIERMQEHLAQDPTLQPVELMKLVGCSPGLASRARLSYFAAHPEQAAFLGLDKPAPPAREQVFALLQEDPTLTPRQLATRIGCTRDTAQRYRSEYGAPPVPKGKKMEQRIRALLAENPHYTPSQIQYRTNYSLQKVRRVLARIQVEGVPS